MRHSISSDSRTPALAGAAINWNALPTKFIGHVISLLMNASKYDDFSFLLPHLLGTNRLLFKAVLRFLSRFTRLVPGRLPDVNKVRNMPPDGIHSIGGRSSHILSPLSVVQAVKTACDRQGAAPLSNFVEYARLNNGTVAEDALQMILDAMELDPTNVPHVFSNSLMENVKPHLEAAFEPPQALVRLQRFIVKRSFGFSSISILLVSSHALFRRIQAYCLSASTYLIPRSAKTNKCS
jgi:hypothetical protein